MKDIQVGVFACLEHPEERVMRQNATDAPLIPRCLADLDVVTLIGLLRWRMGMKRCEIHAFLERKGISLSTGTISKCSLDFLLLFKCLHESHCAEIRAVLSRQGGAILHIDGTHKNGRRVTFVLQEGLSEIITHAALIPSESEEHAVPMLIRYKEGYGLPLVVVRDMSPALQLSVSNAFPGVPQQICQVHFLRELEKKFVCNLHASLKKQLVKHKVTPRLQSLRGNHEKNNDIRELEQQWVHVAADYLLFPIEHGVKWLSRPISYLVQYRRIQEVSAMTKRLIRWNVSHNIFCRALMDLDTCLKEVLQDQEVRKASSILRHTVEWLDQLRETMRISRTTHLKDTTPDERALRDVKKKLRTTLGKIAQEGRRMEGRYHDIASAIWESFERHWEELFVPAPVVDGRKLQFRRHNNGLESAHRRARKSIRERTGRAETQRDMEQFGDLTGILSNLFNPTYQQEVLHDVTDLSEALGRFIGDLPQLREEYRAVRKGPEIPIPDKKRKAVLEEFLEVLEKPQNMEKLLSGLLAIFERGSGKERSLELSESTPDETISVC